MWAASPCSEIRTKLFQALKKVVKIYSILKLTPLREYTSSISSLHVFCSILTCTTHLKSQQTVSFQLHLPRSPHSMKHHAGSLCLVSFPRPVLMPADLEKRQIIRQSKSKKEKGFRQITAKVSSAILIPLEVLQICFSL